MLWPSRETPSTKTMPPHCISRREVRATFKRYLCRYAKLSLSSLSEPSVCQLSLLVPSTVPYEDGTHAVLLL